MVFLSSSKDCPLFNGFSFIQRLSPVQWFFIHPKTVYCTMVFHSSKDCPLHYSFPPPRTMFIHTSHCLLLSVHDYSHSVLLHPSFFVSSLPSCSLCISFDAFQRQIYCLSFSLRVQTIVTVFLQLLLT